MKLYIYSFRSGKLEEQVAEAKECAKTYVTLEDAIGGFYKGSRIRKESIGSICGQSGNTIIFLEENRNAAIEKFILGERKEEKLAKAQLDITQKRIAYLENLKQVETPWRKPKRNCLVWRIVITNFIESHVLAVRSSCRPYKRLEVKIEIM